MKFQIFRYRGVKFDVQFVGILGQMGHLYVVLLCHS